MSGKKGKRGASPFDADIGKRLRVARLEASLSMEALGALFEMSGQQVQKYETGFNRISASMLFEFARVLKKPMVYFFEHVPELVEDKALATEKALRKFVRSKEGTELLIAFQRVGDARKRREILTLVRVIGGAGDHP